MKKVSLLQGLLLILSCGIAAFAQPAWFPFLCPVASVVGFALFWICALHCQSSKKLFQLSVLWYGAVQAIQLSWMMSDAYQGFYIHILHILLALALGIQFGLLTLFVRYLDPKHLYTAFGGAGLWALMEWSRLLVLSGFTFNPIGISLSFPLYPLQLASLGGVFFLSFWIIATNLIGLRAVLLRRSKPAYLLWLALAAFPYLFGWAHVSYHEDAMKQSPANQIPIALYQSGEPPKDILFQAGEDPFDFSWEQWKKLVDHIAGDDKPRTALLVLPEGFVFFGYSVPAYPLAAVSQLMNEQFAKRYKNAEAPPLQPPYAVQLDYRGRKEWFVTNAYWCQVLANTLHCDLVAGLSDVERHADGKSDAYNAAFLFKPNSQNPERYEKRILVPMSEYLPFSFARALAAKYGITGSWTAGKASKVFRGDLTPPINPTICYEETFGDIVREGCASGGKLIVNVTNDVWFPNSKLPQQHFDHALLRAVENGVPLVRSCNTGVTGAIDSLGRVVSTLKDSNGMHEWLCDVLYTDLSVYSYQTIYTRFGDTAILSLSFVSIFAALISRLIQQKKRPMPAL